MTLTAYIETPPQGHSPRRHPRRSIRLAAAATDEVGSTKAIVHDLSRSGLLIQTDADWEIGDRVELGLAGATAEAQVVWRDGAHLGCRFLTPLTQAQLSAALLKADPQAPSIRAPSNDDAIEPVEPDDRLSFSKRLRFLLGATVACWAAIFGLLAMVG